MLSSLRAIVFIVVVVLLAGCEGDQLPAIASDEAVDTPRVISLDERVNDSSTPADSAPAAGASTRLMGIEARLWDPRSGTFTAAGDSVGISADAPSGALLVVVGGHAPGGTIPGTVQLEATEGERTVFSAGFSPSFQVGGDGTFRAPFLVSGARCLPLKLIARSDGGREVTRTVVFTCDP